MEKKRKTKQFTLTDAEALLKKIEQETKQSIKGHLGGNWRDNLFEILMTRMETADKYRKDYAQITAALQKDPKAAPKFAKNLYNTMHNILFMAKAPASTIHVTALTALYLTLIDSFFKDDTNDLSKTMAALDKRLGHFEELVNFITCPTASKKH